LALSSRNGYLSAEERAEAVQLSRALKALAQAARSGLARGEFDVAQAEQAALAGLRDRGWAPDYLTLRHQSDLSPVMVLSHAPMVVLGAAKLGKTRLIDNLELAFGAAPH
jgi:pantoate--beta-alanine ligase